MRLAKSLRRFTTVSQKDSIQPTFNPRRPCLSSCLSTLYRGGDASLTCAGRDLAKSCPFLETKRNRSPQFVASQGTADRRARGIYTVWDLSVHGLCDPKRTLDALFNGQVARQRKKRSGVRSSDFSLTTVPGAVSDSDRRQLVFSLKAG